jgi:hypothetical protein
MACLVILAVLYSLSLSVFNQSYNGAQQQSTEEQIQSALSDGLRVASLPGNHFTFPTGTVSQIALPSPWGISSGEAGGNTLSGYVVTGGGAKANELLVVNYVNGVCVIGIANSSEAMYWGTSITNAGSCQASNFSTVTSDITGTKLNPSLVTLP